MPPDSSRDFLVFWIISVGFGLVGLVYSLINLLRNPQIVPVSERQSIYSKHQLERILREKPVYRDIWVSESAILIMKNQKLTQINFYDIAHLDILKVKISDIYTYTIQITDTFEKLHSCNFDSKDTALAFVEHLIKMAPQACLESNLKKESSYQIMKKTCTKSFSALDVNRQKEQGVALHKQYTLEFLEI